MEDDRVSTPTGYPHHQGLLLLRLQITRLHAVSLVPPAADTAFWFMEGDAFLQFSLPSPNNPQIMVCHSPS